MPPIPERDALFSPLEYAPSYVVYAPHFPYALWLALLYRGATLPSIANPSIVSGGLVGESKTDLHTLVGELGRAHFAPFITTLAGAASEKIKKSLAAAGLSFPLVAKPDIGRNGRGVKIVKSDGELSRYLASFPNDVQMVLQRYIPDEGEAGVFYVRKPSEAHGRITSLTLKYFPKVVGDGTATVRELIKRDPRASRIARIYFKRNQRDLDRVIAAGEEYRLVSVGNHVRGALFVDGAEHITPAMTEVFDRIAKDIDGFYFGRFDVRFRELEDLKRGKDFTIIEYNGASSEPTHVWDRRTSVIATYRALLDHCRMAFAVGAENRKRGAKPMSLREILRLRKIEIDLINRYPDEE